MHDREEVLERFAEMLNLADLDARQIRLIIVASTRELERREGRPDLPSPIVPCVHCAVPWRPCACVDETVASCPSCSRYLSPSRRCGCAVTGGDPIVSPWCPSAMARGLRPPAVDLG